MKNQKGSAVVWAIIIIAILVIAGGIYFYSRNSSVSTAPIQTTTGAPAPTVSVNLNPSSQPSNSNAYSLSQCGLSVTVKVDQPVNVASSSAASVYWLTVGNNPTTSYDLLNASCRKASDFAPLNIQQILGIDAPSDASQVNKVDYSVFDQNTLSNIPALYSEVPAPHHPGSEEVGFERNGWIYEFTFSNPQDARNQNSFVISVLSDAQSNGVIKIYSISPTSGPVGTEITLKGNFSDGDWAGPEYSTQAVIENSSGGQAIVENMPNNDTASFPIKDKMCSVNEGGSGAPCPSPVNISPGKYTIYYENAYFKEISNGVTFTVTSQ